MLGIIDERYKRHGLPQTRSEGTVSWVRYLRESSKGGDWVAVAHWVQDNEASHHSGKVWKGGSDIGAAINHLLNHVFPLKGESKAATEATKLVVAECDCEADFSFSPFGPTPARYMSEYGLLGQEAALLDQFFAGQVCLEGICYVPVGK